MYTRSYSKGEVRTSLPPDYGGTALVVGAPPPPRETPITAERSPRRPSARCRDCTVLSGENAGESDQIQPEDLSNDISEPINTSAEHPCCPEAPTDEGIFSAALFDPGHLKNDDLLLLGLIFLMFKEGEGREGCKEMLLILAVLYLSGMK